MALQKKSQSHDPKKSIAVIVIGMATTTVRRNPLAGILTQVKGVVIRQGDALLSPVSHNLCGW